MTKPRNPPRTSQRFARRGENEWRRLIERQRVSGLTQAAFCEHESVSLASFGYWQRRLRTMMPVVQAPPEPFVELGPLQSQARPTMTLVRLELGDGVVLEVSRR